MHIGILHYAAPPVVGGVELTIFHHARILSQLGHQVTVVAGQGGQFLPGLTCHLEPLAGSRDPAILQAGKALAGGHIPANFDELVDQTRRHLLAHFSGCDIIIGHNLFTLHKNLVLTQAVYTLTHRNSGPPWVAWHHDFAWLRPQYQAELHPGQPWELLKQPWPGVTHVTVSQAQQYSLAGLYRVPADDIAVITPGVDPPAFYRLPPTITALMDQWNLYAADCLFLLPARITRRKNIELGLHWLAAVRRESGWDARLIITGPPGPHNPANAAYLDSLLATRSQLNLDAAAHFAYQVNPTGDAPLLLDEAELSALYQLADALLFPSRQEGFGIPILEAGLARLPIFAADLPPFHQSAGPYATLFAPDTPLPHVAGTIITTLEKDRAFQLRRRVLHNFSWRNIVESRILPLLTQTASTWRQNMETV